LSTIYGIDFGTTNSCLAVMERGGPRVIEIDGEPLVPSVVSFDRQSGETIVGSRARNRLRLFPEDTQRSVKRHMGSEQPLEVGGRSLAAEEIAAEILRHLKNGGERDLASKIERVVITVPAYFADAQRRATIRAGELAGLEVVRIINEPTAAALFYDRARRGAATDRADSVEKILVFDLGGGTFDVSVVAISGEINEVLASCGDNRLGGDDFDQLLAEHLATRADFDLSETHALARLTETAEQAKVDLSARPFVRVIEEALVGQRHLDVELARSSFEELIAEHLHRTMEMAERAVFDARLEVSQIDRVVMVGGSTRIPKIQEWLCQRFACPVEHAVDPSLCVALGAAVQGAILAGDIFDHILVDVAAHSLGMKAVGEEDDPGSFQFLRAGPDTFVPLIRRNSQIPASFSEVFFTHNDQQERVQVEVYQGESRRCSETTLIDDFLFELRPAPAGAEVIAELRYDLDGIVRVMIEQRGFDNRKEVTLNTRQRSADHLEDPLGGDAVDNYMIRKARFLAQQLAADAPLRGRLRDAVKEYEVSLGSGDEEAIDRSEDALLELLDQADEQLAATVAEVSE
jgi:molecular chaperone DnaK